MKIQTLINVVLLTWIFCAVQGVPLSEENNKIDEAKENHPILTKTCISENTFNGFFNCAALRILRTIENYNNEENIKIVPGITIINDNYLKSRQSRHLDDEEIPVEPIKRTNKLVSLILDATSRLISGKSLKIKLPTTTKESLARALEEGRGKMKKVMRPFAMGLGATMLTMVPLMFGGLTMFATKALVMGKVALFVSFLLFASQYFATRGTNWIGYSGYGYGYGTPSYGYGSSYGVPSSVYGTSFNTNSLGWNPAQRTFRSLNVEQEKNDESVNQDLTYSTIN